MKILIINYHFPPSITAHSYRWSLLRNYFLTKGHDVDVICGGNHCPNDIVNNIKRVNFPKTIKNKNILIGNDNSHTFSLMHRIKLFFKKCYRKIFWPDGLWHWLPFVLFEIIKIKIKIKNKKYDLIIGYSPTFSSLLASYLYKKIHKDVFFVVDFGDPFSISQEMPVNNYFLYDRLNKYMESMIFKSADMISFTNVKTFNLYSLKYPEIKKFKIISHLVNVNDFYEEKKSIKLKTIIGYIGAFHKNIREPYLVISKIKKLKGKGYIFKFYGALNGLEFYESDIIKHYGIIDREKALEITKTLDVIINVENEDCPMTPSKIFECMATGKPILNFLSSTGISSFLNYPLVLNIDHSTNIDIIEEFISENKNICLSKKEVEIILQGKTLNDIGDKYLNIGS